MRDTRGESGRKRRNRERERESTRTRWQSGTGWRPRCDEREGEEHGAKKETKRVGTRREREARAAGRRWKKDVKRGTRRGRKAVLLMGPLSGLAALCDLQLKSSPSLPAPANRLSAPRRVICCEFINATIARRSNAPPRPFRAEFGPRRGPRTRAYSIELLNFQVERDVSPFQLRHKQFFTELLDLMIQR